MTPRSFKDNEGRVWIVAIVYNTIVNVLAQTGLDLRQLVEDHDHTARELDDPIKLREVISIVLADQLNKVKVSIDDLFAAIATEQQATSMVMSLYQATFDFFQNQGGVLNDALTRMQKAAESAQKLAMSRMQETIDSGKLDRYLEIFMDPMQASQWLVAAQDKAANPEIASVWQEVVEAELAVEKRLPTFIRMVIERDLQLPGSTPSPSAGASPVSLVSTPGSTPGDSSS